MNNQRLEAEPYRIEFSHLAAERILVLHMFGAPTYRDLLGLGQLVRSHPEHGNCRGEIYDLSAASSARVSSQDVLRLASAVGRREPRHGEHVAYVLEADHDYGLGRVFENLVQGADGRERRVTRSFGEALEWIRSVID